MKKLHIILISLLIAITIQIALYFFSSFQEEKKISPLSKEETKSLSENIAHLLVEQLREYAPYYDLQIVINTIKKIENKEEPLKHSEISQKALLDIDSKILIAESEQNLKAAEAFLANLSKNDNFVEVQKGKLYYEVISEGKGSRNITKESAPLLHFTETNLVGKIIRDTREENEPIKIKLSETILGFSHGVSGMRIGERRKVYVHPSLAYGKLSRQQLSIFDVEILNE